jgi:hypothetical protein
MMGGRATGWVAGFWLAICAGLAAVVAWQLFYSFPLAPTVTAAPPAAPMLEPAAAPMEPRLPADGAVEEIAARPLFSADRQLYVASASAPARRALPFELAGTYLSGAHRAALVQLPGRPPEWLRPGDLINGWRVEDIKQDKVQLTKGDREQVLLLRADLASEASGRPTPAKPGQQQPDDPATGEEAHHDDSAAER